MLRRLLSMLWYVCTALVVLAALGLSLGRLALPLLESRSTELEAFVKQTVGQDIAIGRLELGWYGFGPELRMHDVALRDEQSDTPALQLRELRLALDTFRSLWSQKLIPARLVAMGSAIALKRTAAGNIVVQGMHTQTPLANPWVLVFSQSHVELRDIQLQWHDEQGTIPDFVSDNIDLRLRNSGTLHQLQVDVRLAAEYGKHLQLEADLRGAPETFSASLKGWRGAVYLALEQAPLARWLDHTTAQGWQLAGMTDAVLWATLDNGVVQQLRGSVQIDKPSIGSADHQLTPFTADRVATQLDWRSHAAGTGSGWELNLAGLKIDQDGLDAPEASLTVIQQAHADAAQPWQFAAKQLPVQPLAQLLALYPALTAEQRTRLQQLQLAGTLQAVRVDATRRDDNTLAALVYRAQLQAVRSSAVARLPGVTALSGLVSGDLTRGSLELNSQAAQIDLPKLFRDPLQLDRLTGHLQWRQAADRLHIEGRDLRLVNADVRTLSRLILDIPHDGGKPFLELQTAFSDGVIESTHKYLPVGIMPPHAVAWLDRALVSGRLQEGAVLFQGRFGDFPFDRANGRLEVRAVVRDGVLDYRDGWHRIEGLEAELGFVNRSMTIQAVAGKILGSDLPEVSVTIADLAHARLDIDGRATGTLADMLRFLRDSPLSVGRTAALDALHASGDAQLQLALRIPLAKNLPDKLSIDGRVQLADNQLDMPDWELSLEQIKGELHFTQKGMDGRDLSAQLLGVPVRLDVADAPDGEALTRVRARGKLPLLERLHKTQGKVDFLSGGTDWSAAVYLPKRAASNATARVELQSTLRGIQVSLPEPFGKAADTETDFTLAVELKGQGLGPLQLHYGEHSAAVELLRDQGKAEITRAELKLGAADARLPETEGVRIAGHVTQFDWDMWRDVFAGGVQSELLRAVDVKADLVHAFGRSFAGVEIKAQRDSGYWIATLGGPDMQGRLELPPNKPVVLRCRYLHIPAVSEAVATDAERPRIDPASVPALDIEVQQLKFRQLELGQVSLKTAALANGLVVNALQVNADWIRFSSAGEWTRVEGQDASKFHIDVQGGELGQMLTRFGYVGSVEGGETTAVIDAHWLGAPADFSLAKLAGTVELDIGKGRLLNVEAGAGRLFGLFNLQGLRRRLALDFSDVFAKGFGFDRISGKLQLRDGDAHTDNLAIVGPAAHILVTGRTGLAKRDYDQLVMVSPQVSSSIPIAGAIAGGPAVGAALLLADKLLGDQLQELTSFTRYQYTVTGSWDAPVVTPVSNNAARRLQDEDKELAPPVPPVPDAE